MTGRIKNLISTPKGFFYFILGLFWIILYVFLRFFRNLTGYKIIDLRGGDLNYFVLFLFILLILINIVTIFTIFFGWYKNKYGGGMPTKFLVFHFSEKLLFFSNYFFWFPLDSIYKIVEQEIPGSGNFFLFLEKHCFIYAWRRGTSCDRAYFTYFFIFIFDMLPKLVVASLFFIDVIFFEQIKYFLYALPFLFLSTIFKIFLNLMKSFADTGIFVIHNRYLVGTAPAGKEKLIYDGSFKIYESYWIEVKPEYVGTVSPLGEIELILRLQNMLMQAYFVKKEMKKFSAAVTLITSILYFNAGLVRLYVLCAF